MSGLWTELTNRICTLFFLFYYSRRGSLIFLVFKNNTTESSPGHKAAYPRDYSLHFVICVVNAYQLDVCTTLRLQAMCSNGWDWDLGSLDYNSIPATVLLHALAKMTAWLFPFCYPAVKFINLSREEAPLFIDTKFGVVGLPHSPQKTIQQLPTLGLSRYSAFFCPLGGCLRLKEVQHRFS